MFSPLPYTNIKFILSSANVFNFDQSKTLSFGNESFSIKKRMKKYRTRCVLGVEKTTAQHELF